MTTTADKIRALEPQAVPIPEETAWAVGVNHGHSVGWKHGIEAAAALVEAEPLQAVRVKGLIDWLQRECLDVETAEPLYDDAHIDVTAGEVRRRLAALELTPTAVDASRATDPVSKERLEDDVSHSDDVAVNKFALAMKAKLAQARTKGRGGWDDPSQCSELYLAKLLVGHLGKGNPGTFEDVANFAMMLHQRGANPCVLKQAISVLPAPDPVSPTPTLDAMAMQRAAMAACTAELRNTARLLSNPPQSSAAWDARNAIAALPLPADAALAEAMKLPEVVALVEAATKVTYSIGNGDTYFVRLDWMNALANALIAMKGASHE